MSRNMLCDPGDFLPEHVQTLHTQIEFAIAAGKKICLKIDYDDTIHFRTIGKINEINHHLVVLLTNLFKKFGVENFEISVLSARMPDEQVMLYYQHREATIAARLIPFTSLLNKKLEQENIVERVDPKNIQIECLLDVEHPDSWLFLHLHKRNARGQLEHTHSVQTNFSMREFLHYRRNSEQSVFLQDLSETVREKHNADEVVLEFKNTRTKASIIQRTHDTKTGQYFFVLIDDSHFELSEVEKLGNPDIAGLQCLREETMSMLMKPETPPDPENRYRLTVTPKPKNSTDSLNSLDDLISEDRFSKHGLIEI